MENEDTLKKLIDKRNTLFSTWLRTHHHSHRQRYVAQRRLVASEIKRVKNEWFQAKAREVEHGMMTGAAGKGVWQGVREIQRGRCGLQPTRPKVIRNQNGEFCVGPSEVLHRWRDHFDAVLNVRSDYKEDVVLALHQHQLRSDLSEPPTEEEICTAIMRLKSQKAGGKNGILPEMINSCGPHIMDHLCDLFCTVWSEERVPAEWRDALMVPIPKKGDLTLCDNWRGISLLDVVGKVFAKVIQTRLQEVVEEIVLVEEIVPDSQCGFRKGRGCVDMIFCARQMVEKAREHNTSVYMLFVDLRKAYDSIPRQALRLILLKYGIPPRMVNIIMSLHEEMKAEVLVDGQTTPEIDVTNGLRQGCSIAPTLFNLYFNAVIMCWRDRCQSLGVDILYKCGGKLIGEKTRRPSADKVTELLFADDAAVMSPDRESMEEAAQVLGEVTSEWGLTVSVPKTKLLVANAQSESDLEPQPITISGEAIETVNAFKYLGSTIEGNGSIKNDVEDRIAKASRAFGDLKRPVFGDKDLSLATKRLVYRAVVLGVLLCGAEAWATKREHSRRLEVFHNRCLRAILGITTAQQRMGRISSVQVSQMFGMEESIEDLVSARRLRWLGHLARMDDDRLPKKVLFGWLPQRRPPHGTKLRWKDRVRKDMKKFNISEGGWFTAAQVRGYWRGLCTEGLDACTKNRLEMDQAKRRSAAAIYETDGPSRTGFICDTCQRSFRRRQDIARHRCVTTRPKRRMCPPAS